MNKFCVLSKNPKTYFVKRLSEEVGIRDIIVVNPFQMSSLPRGYCYLPRTTGVYHSENDLKLLRDLGDEKILNPLNVLEIFRSKETQYQWFKSHRVLIPDFLCLMETTEDEIRGFFQKHKEVVIKPNHGQGGWGVRLLSLEEALAVFRGEDKSYLLQPYVKGEEIRYFFIKGKDPFVQRRIPTKGIAANFQMEGVSEVIELPLELQREIEKVIHLSGAFYGAVDCFKVENRIIFLELNTVPGIEQAEKVSGRNLIREILSLFNN